MGKIEDIPSDIREGVRDGLGRKTQAAFARVVNLEVKPDKFDTRVMALTDYRFYILTPKAPMKIETSVHFLDINALESKSQNKMIINTESKRFVMTSMSQEEDADDFGRASVHVLASLAKVFPNVPTERLIAKVDVSPATRLHDSRLPSSNLGALDEGPCGNFSTMYRCMCDYHTVEYQEDLAWDVDTIYLSQNCKEMNLNDFDHLNARHLLPIISALEHNTWFTGINTSNLKLSPEAVNEILKIMKTNITIEQLVLSNAGLRADFAQRLCMSLIANTGSPITVLDLSGNQIEDKGLNHLCGPLTKLSRGLVELNLARTGISARGANRLAEALISNKNILLNLRTLNLSENSFKGEEVVNLFNFLAQPNALTHLQLSSTECALENLFSALLRGCAQNLTHLDLSGNQFTYKKPVKETSVPPSWKQFFSSAISLKSVNFSGTRLPPDALRCVLEGIGSNPMLDDLELNLSGNGFGLPGNQGAQVLEKCLSTVRNIGHLDISDNGFDVALASILGKLSQNKSLRKLSIGHNLNNIKPKNVLQVIEAIIQLIHQDCSPITCLNVDNLRLKSETVLLINALGTNDTLTQIDLSGNQMGDVGARMLSKALLINKKLNVIYWDHNGTSPNGFHDVANALDKNFSVRKMPTPVNDATQALRLNPERTEQALQKIETILQRNHSPRKMPTEQAYRLQQGFMVSTWQQAMDRHVVQLQDLIEKLGCLQKKYQLSNLNSVQTELAKAQGLMREAEASRMFLLQLQKVVQESEMDSLLQKQLTSLATSLHDMASKQLKANSSAMIDCAENQFPMTLKNEELREEITVLSTSKSQLCAEFVHGLVLNHLAADVMNKMNELNLSVASSISDCILDRVMIELEQSVQSLNSSLSSVRSHLLVSGQLKDEDKESKEYRENLKRNKSTSSVIVDEEQDVASEMSSAWDKHKSQLHRRLRPQSAIDASDVKKALELCRIKAEAIDQEHRSESGSERTSSEERKLETSSPVPTPLPRKRRGQSDAKSLTASATKSESRKMDAEVETQPLVSDSKTRSDSNAAGIKADVGDGSNRKLEGGTSSAKAVPQTVAVGPSKKSDFGMTLAPVVAELKRKSNVMADSQDQLPEHSTGLKRSPDVCVSDSTDVSQRPSEKKTSDLATDATKDTSKAALAAVPKTLAIAPGSPRKQPSDDTKRENTLSPVERGSKVDGTVNQEESSPESSPEEASLKIVEEAEAKMSPQKEGTKKEACSALEVTVKERADSTVALDDADGKTFAAAKTRAPDSSMDFFPPEDTVVPKLEHLGKDRPKRPKTKAATRPVVQSPVIEEVDVSRGVSSFFDNKPLPVPESKPNGEVAVAEEPEEAVKSNVSSNKKEKPKPATFSPKQESKGFKSGIIGFFKKKSTDLPEVPTSSVKANVDLPSPDSQTSQKGDEKCSERGDDSSISEEHSKKEVEEPVENRPRHPAGANRFGLPGMAGNIAAELKAKRAAPKPVHASGDNGKSSSSDATKEKQIVDNKSKESNESPSLEENAPGASSRLSLKGRPPPPLAPKPNKRMSIGGSPAASTTANSATNSASSAANSTSSASKSEAEEAQQVQESEQKIDPLQALDVTTPDRKKRISVREKAANIDKNRNVKSADSAVSSKKSATLPSDNSAKLSETIAQRPSSDYSVDLNSSALSATTSDAAESEPPPVPSDPPPRDEEEEEDGSSSQTAAKRHSDVDVIHI